MTLRLLSALALLLLFGIATPARADDISVAGRGVVRVVTIASAEGQIVGFGHGSGFAVAPNRIVTNAHVVELAARYPANVVIGVVPSEGAKSYRGRLIAYDARRDLALIEFSGVRLPPLTLFPGPVNDGEPVIALGYPGNVDLATAQSAEDYIKPLSPVRSQGGFAGRRALSGVDVLLHTASIARGNSGGPLLDQCGRVIGVNSAITRAEEGDSTFGFAVANTDFTAFLRESGQAVNTTGVTCISAEDRLKQDEEEAARRERDQAQASQSETRRAAEAREAAMDAARERQYWLRENFIGGATLLLVLGALAAGAGGLAASQGQRGRARDAMIAGGALTLAALLTFFLRPTGPVKLPAAAAASAPAATGDAIAYGKLSCRIVPGRSRINLSRAEDVALDWGKDGCMNGSTQYAENGRKWERILVPKADQTVSVLEYRPEARIYTDNRYYLTASQMERVRALRGSMTLKACTASGADRMLLQQQQQAVRATLPGRPDEWLSYDCAPGSAEPEPVPPPAK